MHWSQGQKVKFQGHMVIERGAGMGMCTNSAQYTTSFQYKYTLEITSVSHSCTLYVYRSGNALLHLRHCSGLSLVCCFMTWYFRSVLRLHVDEQNSHWKTGLWPEWISLWDCTHAFTPAHQSASNSLTELCYNVTQQCCTSSSDTVHTGISTCKSANTSIHTNWHPLILKLGSVYITHTHTYTYNCFTALLDFVRDYPGQPAPER